MLHGTETGNHAQSSLTATVFRYNRYYAGNYDASKKFHLKHYCFTFSGLVIQSELTPEYISLASH